MIQYKNRDWKKLYDKIIMERKTIDAEIWYRKISWGEFCGFPHKGLLGSGEARKSMEEMAHKTNANWVILTPRGYRRPLIVKKSVSTGRKAARMRNCVI